MEKRCEEGRGKREKYENINSHGGTQERWLEQNTAAEQERRCEESEG